MVGGGAGRREGEGRDGWEGGRVGVVRGSPWKPQEALYTQPFSQKRNQSRRRHVGHARRSKTTAMRVSQRSTLHVWDAVLVYTARVQGCAGL